MFKVEELDFTTSNRIFIWGYMPGLGKTMLLVYLMQLAMFQTVHSVTYSYDEVDNINECGYHFTKKYEHLCFTNFDINCLGTEYPFLRSYVASPYEVGFDFNGTTKPFPPSSVFGFTEFQNYYPASMNDYIRPEYLMKYQTSRHDNITFIVDCQRPTDVAKKIRDLFNIFIECCGVKEVVKDGQIIGHRWKVKIIYGALNLEMYMKNRDSSLCEETTIFCPWFLYPCYDSYFCKMLHYKGFENTDFEIRHFGEKDDSNIFVQPNNFFISRTQRVGENNNDEVY